MKKLFSLFILCLPNFLQAQIISAKQEQKPNIIFILTDDLGYGDIGVFFQNQCQQLNDKSKPFQLTPNIDALANSGAIFTQQYCNAPVCAPSRASFLTGVNQGNATVRDNQFDKALEDNHTIASLLKKGGYSTTAIGKWGLQGEKEEAPNWPAHPLKRGFDDFFGYMRHMDGHEHYPAEGLYRGKKEVWENYTNVADGLSKCYTTDLWTARAKKWIVEHEKTNAAKPFFMYLAYDAPHAVLELPTQVYPKGKGLHGGLQWLNISGQMINTASGIIDTYIYPEYKNATYDDDNNAATPEVAWPETYKRYATANRRIDDAVGDLTQLLKDLKIDSNTLIVFTSDNGPSIESYLPASFVPNEPTFFSSYGPFDGIKRDCWEGGVRMPTIAAWPNYIQRGKIINTPSMLSDWMATFADLAQIPVPARSDGVSLLPSLTAKGIQEKGLQYVEYFGGDRTPDFKEFEPSRRGEIRGQMQLIRLNDLVGVRYNIKSADDDFEIYNVVTDPKQTKNLASSPEFAALQLQMKEKVLQLRRSDSTAKRPYDKALIPSNYVTQKIFHGLKWKFFPGDFSWVTTEKGRTLHQQGRTNNLNGKKGSNKNGLILYEGFIKVDADGSYDFSFATSSKAFIRLHEAELFDADFGYEPGTLLTKQLFLKGGYHPIKIYLLKNKNEKILSSLQWKKDGEEKWNLIGKKELFYVKSAG